MCLGQTLLENINHYRGRTLRLLAINLRLHLPVMRFSFIKELAMSKFIGSNGTKQVSVFHFFRTKNEAWDQLEGYAMPERTCRNTSAWFMLE